MRRVLQITLSCWLTTLPVGVVYGQQASTLGEAIIEGSPIFSLRARYETVDQTGKDRGEAITLRTLAGWRTKPIKSTGVTFEGLNVARPASNYNDTLNGKTQFPVITDPAATDVNQLFVSWTALPETLVRGGRQSIVLDNARFVGNVGFRQVIQVFDAVSVSNTSLPRTRLYGDYLARVRTINTRVVDTDTIVLNVSHDVTPDDTIVGYAYLQNQVDAIAGAAFAGATPTDTSNPIIGIRVDCARHLNDDWRLLYTAEVAKQGPYAGGDSRIDASYVRIGAGVRHGDYSLRVDHEVLTSHDGVYGFQTPLATKHPFQGWADQFLLTPKEGLRDTFLSGVVPIGQANLVVQQHWFGSHAGRPASAKVDASKLWVTAIFDL